MRSTGAKAGQGGADRGLYMQSDPAGHFQISDSDPGNDPRLVRFAQRCASDPAADRLFPFITFQLLSYVVDVYRGEVEAQTHFFRLLLYTSLFHQCIAGPIVGTRIFQRKSYIGRSTGARWPGGINRFAAGLAKKAVLANTCGLLADQFILTDAAVADVSQFTQNAAALSAKPAVILWMGVLFFMLQIYLDFSAYSDMAIGMGLMIGFHYKENFNYPYLSSTVSEFWRRWHISLGSFFRDYVYIPLGGSRKGLGRTILNFIRGVGR